MADYPDAIFETRETENLPGLVFNPAQKTVLFSEDYQNLAAEITAIETVLGALVNGDFDTVKEWLEDLNEREFVPYTGATSDVDLGSYNFAAPYFKAYSFGGVVFYSDMGVTPLIDVVGVSLGVIGLQKGPNTAQLDINALTGTHVFAFPNQDGTLALLSDIPDEGLSQAQIMARLSIGF